MWMIAMSILHKTGVLEMAWTEWARSEDRYMGGIGFQLFCVIFGSGTWVVIILLELLGLALPGLSRLDRCVV
ncbi:hypothetical protein EYC80_003198 [Monilinia laxa]|uniref:Uncharacterized protein n=1 Tax=Monilinia laxa TaxID=61186 RepID=A0A5N6KD63_MONLA|nr:hypothetical protein EYC80_003198 [Monilinia laxa]